jgi:molybdopterin molybdotransferase
VLAEDIHALFNVPPFDRSPFDGWALRGEDTSAASLDKPVKLRITEEIPAGGVPSLEVVQGTAAKILTGAPIPRGANATVKYEETSSKEGFAVFTKPVRPNTNIIPAGEDIRKGARVLEKGVRITPAVLGAVASLGYGEIKAYKKPRVAVFSTGSELLAPGEALEPGKIYNSNNYTICGALRNLGIEAESMGIIPDNLDRIAEKLAEAMRDYDAVMSTGGASTGDYDYAVRSAEAIGARLLFHKVNMKPGGSMMAAEKDGKLYIGLSGSPAAALLGLYYIALPYFKKLCGLKTVMPKTVYVHLKNALVKESPKLRILRGKLVVENGRAMFEEDESRGNIAVSSFLESDMLAEVPAGSGKLPAGTLLRGFMI